MVSRVEKEKNRNLLYDDVKFLSKNCDNIEKLHAYRGVFI